MKTYVLCANLEENCLNTLKNLKHDIEINQANIHIVTIYEIQVYNVDLVPYVYPTETQYNEIENSALSVLKGLAQSLGVSENRVTLKCFFDTSRESRIKKYLEEVDADIVVTATKGKHGLAGFFSSSFTDYLCKFSPCDVLVMRPRKETK